MKSYSKDDHPRFSKYFWKGTLVCIVLTFFSASAGIVIIVEIASWIAKKILG